MSEFNAPYFDNSGYPFIKPRETVSEKIRKFYTGNGASGVVAASFVTGISLILYTFFSWGYIQLLSRVGFIRELYVNSDIARTLTEMLYTVLCVGMPFIIVFAVAKKLKLLNVRIPFCRIRKNSHTFFLILSGIAVCFAGNMITNMIISFFAGFGIEFNSFNQAVSETAVIPQNIFQLLLKVAHTAVFPAFFEEIAFRGVVMHSLKKYGDWLSIIISAVLFGLIHGNMTQVPFAIIAGVALGYIVTVTGSIWPGIILHFCNNFISLVISLVRTAFSETASALFSTAAIYGLMLAGAFAFIYFVSVNPCFHRLYPSEVKGLKTEKSVAVFILTPPMIFSVIVMLIPVFKDIVF